MGMLLAITFLFIFSLVMVCAAVVFAHEKSQHRSQFTRMLRTGRMGAHTPAADLLKPSRERGAAEDWLESLQFIATLRTSINQAGMHWSTRKFLLVSIAGALAGALAGSRVRLLSLTLLSALFFAILGGLAPLAVLRRKRKAKIRAFEEQFPEALDFLTRSLKAGHGFGAGLQMLAAEAPDPLGSAIRRVASELQLGCSLELAMRSLADAVPLMDVRFFIAAVVMQRDTGGNLGEILSHLSGLIRERVRLRGKVAVLSAHGRITGLVLLLMPLAVLMILSVMSPEYVTGLTGDPTGQKLLLGAGAGQVLAFVSIRKIVNIKI